MQLIKVLIEARKRYMQLQSMIKNARNADQYMRALNHGLNESIGLLESLPIKDQAILAELKEYKSALIKIRDVYGKIPRSKDEAMHLLHDESIAESLIMASDIRRYADRQKENADIMRRDAMLASPKGAVRMNARMSGEILHTLNQLLRVSGQMLKLRSEEFALNNKEEKDSVFSKQTNESQFQSAIHKNKHSLKLPRF